VKCRGGGGGKRGRRKKRRKKKKRKEKKRREKKRRRKRAQISGMRSNLSAKTKDKNKIKLRSENGPIKKKAFI